MEMIRRYGADTDQGCDFDYMAGLFSAASRAAVVRAMEGGLTAADQPVTGRYLRTLSTPSVYLQHPEFRPAQTRETKGRLVAGGELSRRSDLIDAAMSADDAGCADTSHRRSRQLRPRRERIEYEGALDVDDRLVSDLIGAGRRVADKIRRLPPLPEESK